MYSYMNTTVGICMWTILMKMNCLYIATIFIQFDWPKNGDGWTHAHAQSDFGCRFHVYLCSISVVFTYEYVFYYLTKHADGVETREQLLLRPFLVFTWKTMLAGHGELLGRFALRLIRMTICASVFYASSIMNLRGQGIAYLNQCASWESSHENTGILIRCMCIFSGSIKCHTVSVAIVMCVVETY